MVTYRLANEHDYENINSFHNRIYQSNRTLEEFYWEFHNCPFGQSIYVIAEDNGKVVGTNSVIPIDLIRANKEIIRSGKSEDTLVDPDYRGQGIFYKIYEFLFEKCREANIQVIWGFTSAKKPFSKLGFEIPYDHEQCIAVNDTWKSYKYLSSLNINNKVIDKVKILGLCVLTKAKTIVGMKTPKLTYRVEENTKVVNGIEELIFENQSKTNSVFAIHQTADYQEWRVYTNPNYHKVHTYSFYDDDKLIGLVVCNSHPNRVAYTCQTNFSPSIDMDTKVQILQYATSKLFKDGIVLVRNWSFNTNKINIEETSIHEKSGYKHLERGVGLVWKKLDNIDIQPSDFYLSRIATQGNI